MPMLAAGSVAMALSRHIVVLVGVIYLLRLFGQGMMTQNALTATARWFAANRGRAVSLVALGQNAGEAVFPFVFVIVAGMIGWRMSWVAGAGLLMVFALPAIAALYRRERTPQASDPEPKATAARDWTRGEVLRDPLFWLVLTGTMAPPFIGTTIFFHQVYLVDLRGWSLDLFAASFALMSSMTIVFALVSGALIDRFSAVRMLPSFLLTAWRGLYRAVGFAGAMGAVRLHEPARHFLRFFRARCSGRCGRRSTAPRISARSGR